MVQTRNTELAFALQSAFGGTLPGTPDWHVMERSELSAFGNTVSKSTPTRISRNRNMRKKKTTAIDSSVEFNAPMDFDSMRLLGEGFAHGLASGPAYFSASAATATGATVPALTAGQASQIVANQTILALKGFATDDNNGLKIASTTASASDTEIAVVGGLTAETIAANRRAEVYVAGVRGASGDIEIDADGNLISTALDFTTLGLVAGQAIYIGGVDAANTFSNSENSGFAIVSAIAANKLTLTKRDQPYVTDDGTGVQIDILFGPYIRNYSVDHANYVRQYFMFGLKSIFDAGTKYEYAKDNACDSLSLEVQRDGFVNASFGFVGSITDNPTDTAATGHANAAPLNATEEFSTSTDLARIAIDSIDEDGFMTDFDAVTITIANGISARKVLGQTAAAQLNLGELGVTLEMTALFTDSKVIEHIRCDNPFAFRLPFWNNQGGVMLHVPQMTLEGGARQFPQNETVTVSMTGSAFNEDIDGSSIELTLFPLLPARPCQ